MVYNSNADAPGWQRSDLPLPMQLMVSGSDINRLTLKSERSDSEPNAYRKKDRAVLKLIGKYNISGKIYLSPSALNTYMDCRLKFYLEWPSEKTDESDTE